MFIGIQGRASYLSAVLLNRSPAVLTRLFLALLLATIGIQAIPFGKIDVEQQHGSAFSAATSELAVAARAEPLPLRVILPTPALPPVDDLIPLALRPSEKPLATAWAAPSPALAAPRIAKLPYPPRAPPHA